MQRRVIHHPVTDSTTERAFAALRGGAAEDGDVHTADEQTAGRGRLGRSWSSPPGGDLYASLILLPPPPGPAPAGLTIAVGLGVLRGLERLGANDLSLKWPNDVIDGSGAKLAGVLIESRGLDSSAPHFVAGFGVNVTRTEFPPELLAERPVTSLALAGITADASQVLEAILPEIDAALTQLTAAARVLCSAFVQRAGLHEGAVELTRAGETLRGRILSLDLDQGITLASAEGSQVTIALEHVAALRRI